MDNVKDIAVGVLSTGSLPAHLGLNTDAEKIEWLARQLERLSDEAVDAEALQDKLDTAEESRTDVESELEDLETCAKCALCDEHKKVKSQ